MKKQRTTIYLLVISLTAMLLSGCKGSAEVTETTADTTVESVVTETTEATTETTGLKLYSAEEYRNAGVNELNSVPILMYHRIYDKTNAETSYTGGNVDKDGYNRTSEAFEADLRSFYQQGYRMMRLTDFVDGNIDVAFGYSPLILTFDDGIRDVVLLGWDADGTPLFDPSCAIGILEKIKAEYPDYNVTATFFVNSQLFENGEENDRKVMKWMVDNGYDIGNHTRDHAKLGDCDAEEIEKQVGYIYKKLDEIIPGQYVNIVALPYGSPESMPEDKPQYNKIFAGTYEGFSYTSKASLLCAWTRSYSPFVRDYNNTAIRRIRGYDNNGSDWDIEMNFEQLNNGKRYISDGEPDTIVFPASENESGDWLKTTYGHQVVTY
ncbi:MAG: polysaccharide deacetylase family protein [Lachnospiraceae bacterium]|nr:polysaccharide deacetylase family protein [Lachnospiraceae bacterium]